MQGVKGFGGGTPSPSSSSSSSSSSSEAGSSHSSSSAQPLSPSALDEEESSLLYSELAFQEQIGAGSFGKVFRGTFRGSEVAIKSLALRQLQSASMMKYLHSELAVLR